MKFSAEFLTQGRNASDAEASTVARIRVFVDGRVVTQLRKNDERTITDHVIAPVYPLAEGIAHRWWTILYGRGRAHSLLSMRAGYALPGVVFIGDGRGRFDVHCEPFRYENPKIEFVERAAEHVSARELETSFADLINVATERLGSKNLNGTPLQRRWAMIAESMSSSDELAFCRAAGALGVEPYTCNDKASEILEKSARVFEEDSLEEFLAGIKPEAAFTALGWLDDAESRSDACSTLPAIEELRASIRFNKTKASSEPAWAIGYKSARTTRGKIGLNDSEPVGAFSALAERLGNRSFRAAEQSHTGLRGVSRIVSGKPQAIVAGNRNPATLLFSLGRTIGDALHFGSPHRSPITEQEGTFRQQVGRAFAAELLAPVKAVVERREAGVSLEDIADDFGVDVRVVEHQIENRANALSI